MAELYNFGPLICGKSTQDQLYRIFAIFGSPTEETWKEATDKCKEIEFEINPEF